MMSGRDSAARLVVMCGTALAATIDARTGYIPDRLLVSMALVVGALAVGPGAAAAVAGAGAGGGTLLVIYLVTRGRGIGFGDVKLATVLGGAYGAAGAMLVLCVAFVAGSAYGIWLLLTRRASRRTAIPFAPFLAVGVFAGAILS